MRSFLRLCCEAAWACIPIAPPGAGASGAGPVRNSAGAVAGVQLGMVVLEVVLAAVVAHALELLNLVAGLAVVHAGGELIFGEQRLAIAALFHAKRHEQLVQRAILYRVDKSALPI